MQLAILNTVDAYSWSSASVFREGELADMKMCIVFCALALCSFIAATLSCQGAHYSRNCNTKLALFLKGYRGIAVRMRCTDNCIFVHTIVIFTCFPAEVDVQTISNVLSGVDNWEVLAGWLNIANGLIQAECQPKMNGVKHECYRSSLVRRYCQKSGSREEVVENMAQVLEEKMDNKWKAQELRRLRFGECRMIKDSVMYFTLDIWPNNI